MNYNTLFSKVVSRSKASAIRELLKVISRPEIISFAGGHWVRRRYTGGRGSAGAAREAGISFGGTRSLLVSWESPSVVVNIFNNKPFNTHIALDACFSI